MSTPTCVTTARTVRVAFWVAEERLGRLFNGKTIDESDIRGLANTYLSLTELPDHVVLEDLHVRRDERWLDFWIVEVMIRVSDLWGPEQLAAYALEHYPYMQGLVEDNQNLRFVVIAERALLPKCPCPHRAWFPFEPIDISVMETSAAI